MIIAVFGKGGREHAIADTLTLSDEVEKVYVYPGNPGMTLLNEKIDTFDQMTLDQFIDMLILKNVRYAIIGPEQYLYDGLSNRMRELKIKVLGVSQDAAILEKSKNFSKYFMHKQGIPTAEYIHSRSVEELILFSKKLNNQVVIKKSGPALGKGVHVLEEEDQLLPILKTYLKEVDDEILIEERLYGKEVSVFYLCRGEEYYFFGDACDYKRVNDFNTGPNTGGMGAFSPSGKMSSDLRDIVEREIVKKTLKGLKNEGIYFEGIMFLGLIITNTGVKVLEYNVRFGDPETQALLPLYGNDFWPLVKKFLDGENCHNLNNVSFENKKAVHIVKASQNYPEVPVIGKIIKTDTSELDKGGKYYFASVVKDDKSLLTSGGRVCGITVVSDSLINARKSCYEKLNIVSFDGEIFRSDIGIEY